MPQEEEMSALDKFFSYLQYQYQRYVLNFSKDDQESLVESMMTKLEEMGEMIKNISLPMNQLRSYTRRKPSQKCYSWSDTVEHQKLTRGVVTATNRT